MISGLAQQRLWCFAQSASAFPVHPADPVCGNLSGTDRLAFEVAAAAAEALGLHLALHGVGAAGPFWLPLR